MIPLVATFVSPIFKERTHETVFDTSDHYDLGVPILDVQLRELVAAATTLYHAVMTGQDALTAQAKLDVLIATANFHFAMEEKMMERHGYNDIEIHVKQHRIFVETVSDYQQFAAAGQAGRAKDAVAELKSWLRSHITRSDKAFAETIRDRRAA